jgi:cation diffusion facilitator family transporter
MKSRLFIYIALLSDGAIAAIKFLAAAITGSAAMLSEAIHSVIDCISQILLLWGIKRSMRKPDQRRPFGYGRELYFWSFLVSLIIFTIGGCISFYEGIGRLMHPVVSRDGHWNYIVLGVGFVFTIISIIPSFKAFNKQRGEVSFWRAIIDSKDPTTLIVLLSDIGDLLGLVVAFLGIFLSKQFHNPAYDGIASIIISLILITISLLLVKESRSLLMGETPSKRTIHKIIAIAEADDAIIKVKRHFSMYLAPEEIIFQLIAVFKDNLTTAEITDAIERISEKIRQKFPRVKQIFIEPGDGG